MLNFEIPFPQSTVIKFSFSDKVLLHTLVLEMHEQGMTRDWKSSWDALDTGASNHQTQIKLCPVFIGAVTS
jgi:hypothetical protein